MAGTLDNTPADITGQLLADLGLVASSGVFIGNEPDDPDSCVTVYDTTNVVQGRQMHGGVMWEFFGIQVRVRAPKQPQASHLCRRIAIALEQQVYDRVVSLQESVGTATASYKVHAYRRVSGPMPLGKEEPTSRRSLFTVNLLVGLKQIG